MGTRYGAFPSAGDTPCRVEKSEIASHVLHANIGLLRYVTFETFYKVADLRGLNEFVFAGTLSPIIDDKQMEAVVERCLFSLAGEDRTDERYSTLQSMVEMLLEFREIVVPRYLAECAAEILAHSPTVVGFTCLFDQTLASVAVAKLIKEVSPATLVVLGGYALEGPPGNQIPQTFPWVDCIARGDGEPVIAEIARASVGIRALHGIPGLLVRGHVPTLAKKIDLNLSPDPDYENWRPTETRFSFEIRDSVIRERLY